MLVLLASPRWRWCPGEYLLVPYGFRFCMQLANICQDTSTIWEKPIKPTFRAYKWVTWRGRREGVFVIIIVCGLETLKGVLTSSKDGLYM